jgi:hypothetical protein
MGIQHIDDLGEIGERPGLLFWKMQGDFEKMQRGANCNRAKTGPSSMACMGFSLLTEQGENHCLAGIFWGKTSAESRITDKIK